MKNSKTSGVFTLMFVGFAGACGTTAGNPRTDVSSATVGQVSLVFQGSRGGTTTGRFGRLAALTSSSSVTTAVSNAQGATIGTLTLTQARVVLKEIKIQTAQNSGKSSDGEIRFRGPYIVDLIGDSVSSSIPAITLSVGSYKVIEMKLDKIEGDEKDTNGVALVSPSDPLFGNSIYVAGTYTGQTASGNVTAMPFQMSYDIDETFELKSAGASDRAFSVTGGNNPLIVAFRLARWLTFNNSETNSDSIDFSMLTVGLDSQGASAVILDKNSEDPNKKIREVIKKNIEKSGDFGKDIDGSGKLDTGEGVDD